MSNQHLICKTPLVALENLLAEREPLRAQKFLQILDLKLKEQVVDFDLARALRDHKAKYPEIQLLLDL